jgi:hypothetical protein
VRKRRRMAAHAREGHPAPLLISLPAGRWVNPRPTVLFMICSH